MPAHDSVHLSHELRLEHAPQSLLLKRVMDAGLPYVRADAWATSATSLEPVGAPELSYSMEAGAQRVYRFDDEVVFVSLFHGHASCTAAAPNEGAAQARIHWLRELLPPPDPSSAHEVNVTFWTYGPHGPQPSWRSISVPEWDEIRENYSSGTRAALEGLMSGFRPAHGGQLVLWHGEAGTGKTFALRALAWEWRNWCDLHYIVDPDSFFGEHADYLMSVLLQPQYAMPMAVADGGWSAYGEVTSMEILRDQADEQRRSWQLLILEDTGELLTADAKAVIGQGLSRFLNVVDGLIGQGLRVLVLVTTNEAIRTLHPAVARPGRCAANVEFHRLAADEAEAWLRRREVEGEEAKGATTIASLYARAEGLAGGERPLTGFGE